jgi:hypothetical protein
MGIAIVKGWIKFTMARETNSGSRNVFRLTMCVQRVSNFRGGRARALARDRRTALDIARTPSAHRMPGPSSTFVSTNTHTILPRAAAAKISKRSTQKLEVLTRKHHTLRQSTMLRKVLRQNGCENVYEDPGSETSQNALASHKCC